MNLTLHQAVLAYGALNDDPRATVNYRVRRGKRNIAKWLDPHAWPDLVAKFRKEPFPVLEVLAQNMIAIAQDDQMSEAEKELRVERYLDDYSALQLKLDADAWPSTGDKVYRGIPDYVPDGFSDMGADPGVQDVFRKGREKLRVRKQHLLNQAKDLFRQVFLKGSLEERPRAESIYRWVYETIPYDARTFGGGWGNGSVNLDDIYQAAHGGVCRHHALATQVLNQAFGLESRLLKCTLNGGSHGANLVRLDGVWHLEDVTNPRSRHGQLAYFLVPLSVSEIDLNEDSYSWEIASQGEQRIYCSRNDMFYQIKNTTQK